MKAFIDYFSSNASTIFDLFTEHIELTFFAIIASIIIGVPLGILISYVKPAKKPIMGITNIIQAIPSMALLGFLIPFVGIGTKPAIIMVILYSLLPIVKNTYAGIENVNPDTLEAAKGIGLTKFQVLYKVELPLALPVILAGVRISAVSAVGLMTLAAFIGAGGLGYLVYAGIRTVNNAQILSGAIPACLLALFIDYLFSILERKLIPKNLKLSNPQSKIKKYFDNFIIIITCLALITGSFFTIKNSTAETIKIGSMDFTEQEILSYMIKDLIEDRTDIQVEQSLSLGASGIVLDAIKNGDIDMYIDYTGTIYGSVLGHNDTKDTKEILNVCKKEMKSNYGLEVLDELNFNNTYTLAVRRDTAEKYNLKTYSDLEKVSSNLVLSPTLSFMERKDCYKALNNTYNMNFKEVTPIDGSPRYTALQNKDCDVIDAYSTDGLLKKYDLVVLEDDKGAFLRYDAVPVISKELKEKYPQIENILKELGKYLNEDVMIELNYQVDVEGKKSSDVAHDFLIKNGLIK